MSYRAVMSFVAYAPGVMPWGRGIRVPSSTSERRLRGHRCLGVLLELVQPEEEVNDEYCHVLETRKKEHVT